MGSERRTYVFCALLYAVVLEVLLVGAILYWPHMIKSIGALKALAPMEMLRDMVDVVQKSGVAAYVNLQHYFKGCNSLGGLVAVVLAILAVSGEAWRGTLEIWLARPLSRRRILLERYAAGALAVVVPVYATSLTIPALLARVGESLPLGPILLASTHQSLFLLAIYGVTFLASCLCDKPILIAFVALVVALFQFSIYMIKVWTHASMFRLADVFVYDRIFATGALDPAICVPLALVSALACVASVLVFERRVP
jgi:ABC-2 type transport system permease protein